MTPALACLIWGVAMIVLFVALPVAAHRKVGGIHFFRLGWLCISVCRTSKPLTKEIAQ